MFGARRGGLQSSEVRRDCGARRLYLKVDVRLELVKASLFGYRSPCTVWSGRLEDVSPQCGGDGPHQAVTNSAHAGGCRCDDELPSGTPQVMQADIELTICTTPLRIACGNAPSDVPARLEIKLGSCFVLSLPTSSISALKKKKALSDKLLWDDLLYPGRSLPLGWPITGISSVVLAICLRIMYVCSLRARVVGRST